MGNLSLYKSSKGPGYRLIDRLVKQQFDIGGTLMYIHKYLGPKAIGSEDATQNQDVNNISELTIQDILFLENRDRQYSKDIIEIKGAYTLTDLDFNMSQFGMFLAGNSIYISFPINFMVERLGRTLMSGDVLEILHKRDDLLLDPEAKAINAFYVVKDAARQADGYSPMWLPHIWRARCEPLQDSQEFKDILDTVDEQGDKLQDILSTANITQSINDRILEQATSEVPQRNFDDSHFFIQQAGQKLPGSNLRPWIFNGDGIPPNQNERVPHGTFFPQNPDDGDYFLRTDYKPSRLFERQNGVWKQVEDAWRTEFKTPHRTLGEFLEDQTITTLGPLEDETFLERQNLSSVIKPKTIIPNQEDTQEEN